MNDQTDWTYRSVIPRFSMDYPKTVLSVLLLLTVVMVGFFPSIRIDTDPENMLPADHPARVQNDQVKDSFFLHDMIAIAIQPPENSRKITTDQLRRVYELVRELEQAEGIIPTDILSFYTTDDIEGSNGSINVDRLLRSPPEDPEVVEHLLDRVGDHPVLEGLITNRESGAIAIMVPIKDKSYSYSVRQTVLSFWKNQPEAAGKIHVAGLPVAEETFGVEMFFQMATAAPLAFVLIAILMLWFFRSISLVAWSLLLSMMTVLWTMGGLIGLGFTVHIMSSMIPIFLLPVSVLDSIHILSDFTDNFSSGDDRVAVMSDVFEQLFYPILFTSLTSAAGFMSLALAGIPPVRVFGVAVGIGILLAFLLTLTVLPAGTMLWLPKPNTRGEGSLIGRLMRWNIDFARRFEIPILIVTAVLVGLGLYGMTLIEINDNPTRWFMEDHPVRVADRYMNQEFAGTYPAYLVLEAGPGYWHQPKNLSRLKRAEKRIVDHGNVGKLTGLGDLVGKIHDELNGGQVESDFPGSTAAVSQYLFLYENSGNPEDLYRLVNQDGSKLNLWFHLRSGDNKDMASVIEHTETVLAEEGFQLEDQSKWAGITYVNLIWQQVMVNGMAWSLVSAYAVIFLMLWFLFRRIRWALFALIPLTITLIILYGGIGWVGKDYDMPVAVLSALSIGIAVDFAIHYVQRMRQFAVTLEGWPVICEEVAGEPARAISRNAIVIAVGFLPLLISPLRPYVTVGVFMFLIMTISSIATLLGLPGYMEVCHPWMPFNDDEGGEQK